MLLFFTVCLLLSNFNQHVFFSFRSIHHERQPIKFVSASQFSHLDQNESLEQRPLSNLTSWFYFPLQLALIIWPALNCSGRKAWQWSPLQRWGLKHKVFLRFGTRQLTSLLLSTDGKYSFRSKSLLLGKYFSYVKGRDCKPIFLEVRSLHSIS